MRFIDTHSHHYSKRFEKDMEESIERALDKNIIKIMLPNIDRESIEPMFALADKYDIFHPMLGLHPTYVKENYEEELDYIESLLDKRKIYAIGEIGIDLYRDKTFVEEQIIAFERQIEWALDRELPLSIHMRKSFDEVYRSLMKFKDDERLIDKKFRGVFHCFGGDKRQADKIIELGFMLGIGGVVTFKNAGLADVVRDIDLEHIVLETDAPYLSPIRGERNESAYIPIIAHRIAEIKGIRTKEVADITTQNAIDLFSLDLGGQ